MSTTAAEPQCSVLCKGGSGRSRANCGHPAPIHLTARGPLRGIIPQYRTTPLGMAPDPSMSVLPQAPGDRIFYTDGLIEARDRHGDWIELDETLLATLGSDSFDDALGLLIDRLENRVGTLRDDLALLLVECHPWRL